MGEKSVGEKCDRAVREKVCGWKMWQGCAWKSLRVKSFWAKSVWVKCLWVKSLWVKSFWAKSVWMKKYMDKEKYMGEKSEGKNYRRKFRSQTSDNMDRWKAEMGRGREKRRVEESRSEKRKYSCFGSRWWKGPQPLPSVWFGFFWNCSFGVVGFSICQLQMLVNGSLLRL